MKSCVWALLATAAAFSAPPRAPRAAPPPTLRAKKQADTASDAAAAASAASAAAAVQRALGSLASTLANSSSGAWETFVASAVDDVDVAALASLNSTAAVAESLEASRVEIERAVEASLSAWLAERDDALARVASTLPDVNGPDAVEAAVSKTLAEASDFAQIVSASLVAEARSLRSNSTSTVEAALARAAAAAEDPLKDALKKVADATTAAAEFQDGVAAAAAELSGALPTYTASDGRPRKSPGRGSTPPALLKAWRASADRALEAFPAEALVDDSLESARDFLDEVKGNAPSAKELRAMYDAVVGAEAPAPPPRAAAAAIPLAAAPKKSYGAARVVALSLRFVTPLSFAILAAAVAAPALGLSVPVLEAWPLVALAAAETGFAGGRFLNLLRSRGDWVDDLDLEDDDALFSPSKAAPPPKMGYRVLWRRCLDACRDDVRGFVEGWFYDARLETLTRADVEAWIAGNVYGKEIKGDIDDRRARQLAWMVQLLEQRLGAELARPFAFPPGPRSVEFMSAPSQPLERRLHPLLLYAALGAARRAYGLQLKAAGFAKKRAGRLSYWVRDGEAPGDDDGFRPAPVVFAHGIGVGLLPYKDAIAKLAAGARAAGAATYLLELPAISTTLQGEELPRPVDLAADVSLALRSNGDAAAVFVGHSFGSAAMSYVLRHAPDVVAASVFVEPVVFLLNRPNVSNGFLFDKSPDPILDVLRSDPDIAFSMRRRFWWQEAVLWADQIRVPTDVFLSDFDKIVPGAAVRAYLADEADGRLVSVTSLGAKTHGEWQYDEASQDAVVAAALARRAAVDDARRRNALGAYLEALLRSRTRAPTGR